MRNYYIYKHTNLKNGKVYIGQTTNIKKRWNNGKGYKYNKPMFEDIILYGWNNFSHEVLNQTSDIVSASELENKYIREYDATNPLKGYNSVIIHNSKDSKLNNKHSISVFQYGIDGQYISEYPSAAEAERQTGVNYSQISNCCHNKRKQAGGFQWSFEKHDNISETYIGKKKVPAKPRNSTRKTKIQMFSSDGVLLGEYESAKDVERKTGIASTVVRTSYSGNYKKPKEVYFVKSPK